MSSAAPTPGGVSIDCVDACVDFPIFDAKSRSLKKAVLGSAGGAIGRNASNVVVVEALKDICEKKIYLEVEYARCAMILVRHNEGNRDKLADAARIMENVQVETYGSMSKREKVEFILYQMKLQLLLGDLTKLYIVSRKVNPKVLDEPDMQILKISYFLFLFHIQETSADYESASSSLERVLEGLTLVQNQEELDAVDRALTELFQPLLNKAALAESIVLFKCLQNHTAEKIENIRALSDKYEVHLVRNDRAMRLIESFLSRELTTCRVEAYDAQSFLVLSPTYPRSTDFLLALHKQLVKKNLMIVALFFKRARLERIAALLETRFEEVEDNLCDLMLAKLVGGKIDRPARFVEFRGETTDEEVIDKWVKNINEIADMIDFVCERIEREEVKAK